MSFLEGIGRRMSSRVVTRSVIGLALICLLGRLISLITFNMFGFISRFLVGLLVYRWYYYKYRWGSHPLDLTTKDTIGGFCIPLLDERNGDKRMPEHRHWWDWNKCSGANEGWRNSKAGRGVSADRVLIVS